MPSVSFAPTLRSALLVGTVALCPWLPVAPASARDPPVAVEGEVIGVVDGDTIDVLLSAEAAMSLGAPRRKKPIPIRLRIDQVDTPERGQP